MLNADRAAVDSDLKAQSVQIKNIEMQNLDRYLQAIGTQAALILGFAAAESYAVELTSKTNGWLAIGYYVMTTISLVLEMYCVMSGTMVCVLGPTFALNGPSGSMHEAVESMKEERLMILYSFIAGAAFFSFAQMFALFIVAPWHIASICSSIIVVGFIIVYKAIVRIAQKLKFHQIYTDGKVGAVTSGIKTLASFMSQRESSSTTPEKPDLVTVSAADFLVQEGRRVSSFKGHLESGKAPAITALTSETNGLKGGNEDIQMLGRGKDPFKSPGSKKSVKKQGTSSWLGNV